MEDPDLQIRRRNLPHWTLANSVYFVTFRLASGTLSVAERALVLNHIKSGQGKFYHLAAAVVMPDHVHLLIQPIAGYTLSRVMKGIKGVSARLVNECRGSRGQIWQDESWDRIVRDSQELEEKLRYIQENPIKEGLATSADCYDALYVDSDFAC